MGTLRCDPVGPGDWDDIERLFGPNGAYSNCWCTWVLLTGREFDELDGDGRRGVLRERVASGAPTGVLAWDGDEPVGWCAIAPRDAYARMASPRTRVYKRVDDRDSWAITCFYIPRGMRRQGLATALLSAAVEYARTEGATLVEGHPVDLALGPKQASSLYHGTLDMFRAAGFQEVARNGQRPVVRLAL